MKLEPRFNFLLFFFLSFTFVHALHYDQHWSASIKSTEKVEVKSIVSDTENNIWLCGHYETQAEFFASNPSSSIPFDTIEASSLGPRLYLAEYDVSGNIKQLFVGSSTSAVDSFCSSVQSTSLGIRFLVTAKGEGSFKIEGPQSSKDVPISENVALVGSINNDGSLDLVPIASSPYELNTHGLATVEHIGKDDKIVVNVMGVISFKKHLGYYNITRGDNDSLMPSFNNSQTSTSFQSSIKSELRSTFAVFYLNTNLPSLDVTAFKSVHQVKDASIVPGDIKAIVRQGKIVHIVVSGRVDKNVEIEFTPIHRKKKTIEVMVGTFIGFFTAKFDSQPLNQTRMISSPVLQMPIGLLPHPKLNSQFSFYFVVVSPNGPSSNLLEVGRYSVRTGRHVVLGSLVMHGKVTVNHVVLDGDNNIWIGGVQDDGIFALRFDKRRQDYFVQTINERRILPNHRANSGGLIALQVPAGMTFDLAGNFQDSQLKSQIVGLLHYSLQWKNGDEGIYSESDAIKVTKDNASGLNRASYDATIITVAIVVVGGLILCLIYSSSQKSIRQNKAKVEEDSD
eukprot:TRINITY_DN7685_c0_g1_i1.p1 TRINITY_DN7685_c0_g1~~TRINITY_DN7685_c0_g1_i1.p1  ORF type:complete len:565 (-),score=111.87 TRINITY_DN7685_c0_g1_i1:152-1846(-)